MTSPQVKSNLGTITSTHLLIELKKPGNETVWRQYVDRYRPMLIGYMRKLGLSADEVEDLAQQALTSFYKAYQAGKYDREKGRLRDWLFGITRNEIRAWRRRRLAREVQIADDSGRTGFFDHLSDEDRLERLWEQEWRDAVMQRCLEQVRHDVDPKTFQAFTMFVLEETSAAEVARRLDLTANAVFIAKHRVLKRIRDILPEIQEFL